MGLDVEHPPRRRTFRELDDDVQRMAAGFARHGIGPDDRVLVVMAPGVDLYRTVFGALCVGATAVFLDSQVPRTVQLRAVAMAAPAAVVGPARLLRAGVLVPALRRARLRVGIDGSAPGAVALDALAAEPPAAPICVPRGDDDVAFVTFTSGSTGQPKGVPRTHGLLRRQHEAIQANFPMAPDEVAIVGFPMLGIHTLLVGCTAVLVPADPRFDVEHLAAALAEHRATSVGLGPAMWRDLLPVLATRPGRAPELHYVGTGGAPLSLGVARALREQFPEATCYCAYGSSEAEPVARIELGRFLDDATAALADPSRPGGYPVGVPVPEVEVAVVTTGLLDDEARRPGDVRSVELAPGVVGEIVLAGENVVDRYVDDEEATRRTKVRGSDGLVWHRTGDLGWRDEAGGLWLVGRLADRVTTENGRVVDPYPVELAVDEVDGVLRSALVAHEARPHGELVIHERPGTSVDVVAIARLLAERDLHVPIVRAAIPLDTRIRSKIDRVGLRRRRAALLGGRRPLTRSGRRRVPPLLQAGGS